MNRKGPVRCPGAVPAVHPGDILASADPDGDGISPRVAVMGTGLRASAGLPVVATAFVAAPAAGQTAPAR